MVSKIHPRYSGPTLFMLSTITSSICSTTISLQKQLTCWNPRSFLSQFYHYESYRFNYNMIACRLRSGIWLLTHWGPLTHICSRKLAIIGSDNGLSPERRQAIIWSNAGILLIGRLGTNFSESLIKIHTFSFKKMHLKMFGKWRPFCLSLNVLMAEWSWWRDIKGQWNAVNHSVNDNQ